MQCFILVTSLQQVCERRRPESDELRRSGNW